MNLKMEKDIENQLVKQVKHHSDPRMKSVHNIGIPNGHGGTQKGTTTEPPHAHSMAEIDGLQQQNEREKKKNIGDGGLSKPPGSTGDSYGINNRIDGIGKVVGLKERTTHQTSRIASTVGGTYKNEEDLDLKSFNCTINRGPTHGGLQDYQKNLRFTRGYPRVGFVSAGSAVVEVMVDSPALILYQCIKVPDRKELNKFLTTDDILEERGIAFARNIFRLKWQGIKAGRKKVPIKSSGKRKPGTYGSPQTSRVNSRVGETREDSLTSGTTLGTSSAMTSLNHGQEIAKYDLVNNEAQFDTTAEGGSTSIYIKEGVNTKGNDTFSTSGDGYTSNTRNMICPLNERRTRFIDSFVYATPQILDIHAGKVLKSIAFSNLEPGCHYEFFGSVISRQALVPLQQMLRTTVTACLYSHKRNLHCRLHSMKSVDMSRILRRDSSIPVSIEKGDEEAPPFNGVFGTPADWNNQIPDLFSLESKQQKLVDKAVKELGMQKDRVRILGSLDPDAPPIDLDGDFNSMSMGSITGERKVVEGADKEKPVIVRTSLGGLGTGTLEASDGNILFNTLESLPQPWNLGLLAEAINFYGSEHNIQVNDLSNLSSNLSSNLPNTKADKEKMAMKIDRPSIKIDRPIQFSKLRFECLTRFPRILHLGFTAAGSGNGIKYTLDRPNCRIYWAKVDINDDLLAKKTEQTMREIRKKQLGMQGLMQGRRRSLGENDLSHVPQRYIHLSEHDLTIDDPLVSPGQKGQTGQESKNVNSLVSSPGDEEDEDVLLELDKMSSPGKTKTGFDHKTQTGQTGDVVMNTLGNSDHDNLAHEIDRRPVSSEVIKSTLENEAKMKLTNIGGKPRNNGMMHLVGTLDPRLKPEHVRPETTGCDGVVAIRKGMMSGGIMMSCGSVGLNSSTVATFPGTNIPINSGELSQQGVLARNARAQKIVEKFEPSLYVRDRALRMGNVLETGTHVSGLIPLHRSDLGNVFDVVIEALPGNLSTQNLDGWQGAKNEELGTSPDRLGREDPNANVQTVNRFSSKERAALNFEQLTARERMLNVDRLANNSYQGTNMQGRQPYSKSDVEIQIEGKVAAKQKAIGVFSSNGQVSTAFSGAQQIYGSRGLQQAQELSHGRYPTPMGFGDPRYGSIRIPQGNLRRMFDPLYSTLLPRSMIPKPYRLFRSDFISEKQGLCSTGSNTTAGITTLQLPEYLKFLQKNRHTAWARDVESRLILYTAVQGQFSAKDEEIKGYYHHPGQGAKDGSKLRQKYCEAQLFELIRRNQTDKDDHLRKMFGDYSVPVDHTGVGIDGQVRKDGGEPGGRSGGDSAAGAGGTTDGGMQNYPFILQKVGGFDYPDDRPQDTYACNAVNLEGRGKMQKAKLGSTQQAEIDKVTNAGKVKFRNVEDSDSDDPHGQDDYDQLRTSSSSSSSSEDCNGNDGSEDGMMESPGRESPGGQKTDFDEGYNVNRFTFTEAGGKGNTSKKQKKAKFSFHKNKRIETNSKKLGKILGKSIDHTRVSRRRSTSPLPTAIRFQGGGIAGRQTTNVTEDMTRVPHVFKNARVTSTGLSYPIGRGNPDSASQYRNRSARRDEIQWSSTDALTNWESEERIFSSYNFNPQKGGTWKRIEMPWMVGTQNGVGAFSIVRDMPSPKGEKGKKEGVDQDNDVNPVCNPGNESDTNGIEHHESEYASITPALITPALVDDHILKRDVGWSFILPPGTGENREWKIVFKGAKRSVKNDLLEKASIRGRTGLIQAIQGDIEGMQEDREDAAARYAAALTELPSLLEIHAAEIHPADKRFLKTFVTKKSKVDLSTVDFSRVNFSKVDVSKDKPGLESLNVREEKKDAKTSKDVKDSSTKADDKKDHEDSSIVEIGGISALINEENNGQLVDWKLDFVNKNFDGGTAFHVFVRFIEDYIISNSYDHAQKSINNTSNTIQEERSGVNSQERSLARDSGARQEPPGGGILRNGTPKTSSQKTNLTFSDREVQMLTTCGTSKRIVRTLSCHIIIYQGTKSCSFLVPNADPDLELFSIEVKGITRKDVRVYQVPSKIHVFKNGITSKIPKPTPSGGTESPLKTEEKIPGNRLPDAEFLSPVEISNPSNPWLGLGKEKKNTNRDIQMQRRDMIRLSKAVRTGPEYTLITCPLCGWRQSQTLSKLTQKCKKCYSINATVYPFVGDVVRRIAREVGGDHQEIEAKNFLRYYENRKPAPDSRSEAEKNFENERISTMSIKQHRNPAVELRGFRA